MDTAPKRGVGQIALGNPRGLRGWTRAGCPVPAAAQGLQHGRLLLLGFAKAVIDLAVTSFIFSTSPPPTPLSAEPDPRTRPASLSSAGGVAGTAMMSCCRCSSPETVMHAGAPRGSTPAGRAHQAHVLRPTAPPVHKK
jgi:hypothetical protein